MRHMDALGKAGRRRWPTRQRAAVLAVMALLGFALACGRQDAPAHQPEPSPASPAPRHVVVGVSALSATALVQFVGSEYGIYQKHGFDVEVQQIKPSAALAALMSGELAFSTGVDSAIRGIAAGDLPIKIIAVSKRAPTFGLVAGPDVERVQDLRGKVVGVTAASGASLSALKRVLEANGLALQDVQTLVGGDAPVVLQNLVLGMSQAASLSAPGIFEAQDRGYRMLVYMPDQVAFAQTGLVASAEAIQTRRDEVKRMIVANTEIIKFIQANKDRTVATLAKQFDIPTDLAAKTYDFEVPAYTTDPRPSLDDVAATMQEEVEAGTLRQPVPPQRLVASDVIEEALAQPR